MDGGGIGVSAIRRTAMRHMTSAQTHNPETELSGLLQKKGEMITIESLLGDLSPGLKRGVRWTSKGGYSHDQAFQQKPRNQALAYSRPVKMKKYTQNHHERKMIGPLTDPGRSGKTELNEGSGQACITYRTT